MRKKLTKIFAGFAALTALALGGAALASAGQGGSKPTKRPAAVQQGVQKSSAKADGETNDTASKADAETKDSTTAADTDSIQSENGKDDPTEQAGVEQSESGSEVANNDGPGGHADEPGNPQADHQFEGQE